MTITRVRPGAGESLLSTKSNSKRVQQLLAREIYSCDVRGAPVIPVMGTGLCIANGMLVDHRELSGEFEPLFGMAGFASMADVINALSAGAHREEAIFSKNSMTTVVGNLYSRWQASGYPAGGTFGTSGTGRVMDNTSLGALKFTSAAGGRWKHLFTMGLGSTIGLGSVTLYDRLAEYPFTGTTLGPSTFGTQPTLPARDEAGATAGAGVMMFLENFSATATAAVTVTPTYTNQSASGSKTNAFTSIATAALAGTIANPIGKQWLDLQSGDTGVSTIQSYTLSASLLAANMALVLCRPICVVPMLTSNGYVERDLIMQLAKLPRLYDGSCLALNLLANATSCPLFGSLTMAEN